MPLQGVPSLFGGRRGGTAADWVLQAYTVKGAAGADPSQVTTDAINTTGANFLILGLSNYDLDPSIGWISDSKSNSWTKLTSFGSAGGRAVLFYCVPTSVGSGHTFMISDPGQNIYPAVGVLAFKDNVASPVIDQETGNQDSGVSAISYNAPITPSEDGCLIVSLLGTQSAEGSSPAISLGMTIQNSLVYSVGNYLGMHMAWKVQTTAATFNPSWSWTNSISVETVIADWKKS